VDHPVLVNPLQFRDYLRRHPEAAEEYGVLKRELAKSCVQDMDAYMAGKTGFIVNIMLQIEQERKRHSAA
jgi:GrpB-like predicted nucleotidyltransferase (UPF0157 family)